MQPCTSLEHFLHSLDQYQNPPKRQRGEQRAVRIQLPNLDSFLEINKEWLPLAKAQVSAREKFGELADAQTNTRNGKALQKRLREESIPDLPQEILQQILNVVPYNKPKELVPDFANSFEVASSWPGMASKALCEKINREQIPIKELRLTELDSFKFILKIGPHLTYLDLDHIPLYRGHINRLVASCTNLIFLNLLMADNNFVNLSRLSKLKSLTLSGKRITYFKLPLSLEEFMLSVLSHEFTLPELPCLELLTLDTPCLVDLVVPSYSNLKTLIINASKLTQFTFNTQPKLVTCVLRSDDLTVCQLPDLPKIKELRLFLEGVELLKLDHLNSLQILEIIGPSLNHFTIPEDLIELELSLANIQQLDLASNSLKVLKIYSNILNRLSLGTFPNLTELDLRGNELQELQFNSSETYSKLERLTIESVSIEELVLPYFEALSYVSIYGPELTALNFSAIAHSQELELFADNLSLNLDIDPERYKSLNVQAADFEYY